MQLIKLYCHARRIILLLALLTLGFVLTLRLPVFATEETVNTTFTIDNGDEYTSSRQVMLNFTNVSAEVVMMEIGNGTRGRYQAPIPYSNPYSYTLPDNGDSKFYTVRVRLVDSYGLKSKAFSDEIFLRLDYSWEDQTATESGSIIEGNNEATVSAALGANIQEATESSQAATLAEAADSLAEDQATASAITPPTIIDPGITRNTAAEDNPEEEEGTDSGNSASNASAISNASCSDAKPGVPRLLTALPAGDEKITLTWLPAPGRVSYYLLVYGISPGTDQFGVPDISNNQTSFIVGSLTKGTVYYFRIKAGNSCAVGDFSNELSSRIEVRITPSARPSLEVLGESVSAGTPEATVVTTFPPASLAPPPGNERNFFTLDQIWRNILNFIHTLRFPIFRKD